MIRKVSLSVLIAVSCVLASISQTDFSFEHQDVKSRLKKDITIFSSEEFEGREAGTEGEKKAAAYIKLQMKEIGITPMFDSTYLQEFTFQGNWTLGNDNILTINKEEFQLHNDFFVLPNSASGRVYAPALYVGYGLETESHNDYAELTDLKDRIFFMEYYLPDSNNSQGLSQPLEVIQKKIELAQKKGALAVVFVNTKEDRRDPSTSLNQRLGRENIPVLFAKKEVLEFWQQEDTEENVLLAADLIRETHTAFNVAGYIDNQAEHTVVIGGHYDHLGYGGRGSRSPGVNVLHPGADDNASGTAGVLEAARYLFQSDLKGHNYIFIAFSAEEKGLLGSRHFASSDAYNMEKVNYMLNFDMIGRMENSSLTIYGTGSSPIWESTIDSVTPPNITVRKSSSGVGASDHTSFYQKNIPVLFFFSGLHDDYHRPADTEDKINYDGMLTIMDLAYDMIQTFDGAGKLEFTQTAVDQQRRARRSGPLLGIMPDHAFEGEGLRIQAVTDNNPAQRAGMLSGDIITGIGETRVSDIQSYMQALGSLKVNDTVKVKIVREGKEKYLDVVL
jgi:aminopeptidase YwaD